MFISGMNYWQQNNNNLVQDSLKLVDFQQRVPGVAIVWYPVPGANQYVAAPEMEARNTHFRKLSLKLHASVLPTDVMAVDPALAAMRISDGVHWQCSYLSIWGLHPSHDGLKAPPNRWCNDTFNLALVNMVLKLCS
jgi:hypothetical protein